jgi:hypothetical protein
MMVGESWYVGYKVLLQISALRVRRWREGQSGQGQAECRDEHGTSQTMEFHGVSFDCG